MSAMALVGQHEVLVFDLDGTLVDSAGDIAGTLSLALQDCGLEPWAPGRRLPDMFSLLHGIVQSVLALQGVSTTRTDDVVAAYRRRQQTPSYAASVLYPGVVDFLTACHQRGHRMAVCTNKIHAEALRMLEHFRLLDFFSQVVGGDTALHAKPSPDPLLLTLERLGAVPAQALLLGDTHVDALCAQHSRVDFVWHRSGYGGGEVLQHPVAASFQSFSDLSRQMADGSHTAR